MAEDKALVPTDPEKKTPTIAKLLAAKQKQIAAVLPKHLTPERLLRIAVTEINRTPALAQCTAESLIASVITAAQLGLETGGPLGRAYLVPFKVRRKDSKGNDRWVNEAQLIIGYRGMIDLARRTGSVSTIQTEAVYTRDDFEFEYGLHDKLVHRPAEGDRGEFRAAWCLVRFKDGGYQFIVMTKADIDRVMETSQSRGKWGPWKDHYAEMAKKTTIRRIFKTLPVSIEDNMARAMDMDEKADAGLAQDMGLDLDDDWANPLATDAGPMPIGNTAGPEHGETILEGKVEPVDGGPNSPEGEELSPEEDLALALNNATTKAELRKLSALVVGFPDQAGASRLRELYAQRTAALKEGGA